MNRRPSALALSLLQRYVPDSEPLVGDIVEKFAEHPSQLWLWWEVLAAVGGALVSRSGEIRPLQLVDKQPLDAIQRTREVHRQRRDISPTSNPFPASLGLVILGGLVTAVAPILWMGLVTTFLGGVALARFLVAAHERRSPPSNVHWLR